MRRNRRSWTARTEQPCVQVPACMLTEYQEKFAERRTPATQPSKKHQDGRQPMEGRRTTFRLDDVSCELKNNPPKVLKPYVPPESHLRCNSRFAQDYSIQTVEKHNVTKTENYHPTTIKMVHQSVYKEDFQAWKVQKLKPYRLCDNLKVNKGRFVKTTTFKDSYCHKGFIHVRDNFKPVPQMPKVPPPFDGTTNYRSQYVIHPVQSRKPREDPTGLHNNVPATQVLTSHRDPMGQQTKVARPLKPKAAREKNPASFDGTAELCEKFKTWPLGLKHRHRSERYRSPEGPMASVSTTHADYVAHECQRPQPARPAAQTWVKDREPLQAKTTMKEDYKAWGMLRCFPVAQKQELEKTEESTEARSHAPGAAQRVVGRKPAQKPSGRRRTFEEAPTHQSGSFAAKEIAPCPVREGGPLGLELLSRRSPPRRLRKSFSQNTEASKPECGTGQNPPPSLQEITCKISRGKRAS